MYDYLIVGGGSAGCVLAARLSEDPAVQVCLLEAGGADTSAMIQCPAGLLPLAATGYANWRYRTEAQPGLHGRAGYQPRGKVLGGSSAINAMIYARGHSADYDAWAQMGNQGWDYASVLPYFRKAEANARGANAWHGADGPLKVTDLPSPNPHTQQFVQAGVQAGYPANDDFNGADQEGVGLYQVTQHAGERYSVAKAYLKPALGRANLTVLTGVQVTRVVFTDRQATEVEFLDHGRRQVLQARREVLLCAGAFQSPQLLLLSGIGSAQQLHSHGIAVVHDLPGVGRNLQDHIDVVQVWRTPSNNALWGLSPGGIARVLQGVLQWRRSRTGLLTSNLAEAGGFIKSNPQEAIPDLQLHFMVGKQYDHGRRLTWGHGFSCHVCLLRPKSRGSVSLQSADPLHAPRIDPNFLSVFEDVDKLRAGVKLVQNIVRQPALAALKGIDASDLGSAPTDSQIERFIRRRADTIYHPVGTCRMGHGADAVVDVKLRVHGVGGLRVVDASIMPQLVGGNTNAPVVMIAEKAADMIKAQALRGGPSRF